MVTLPIITEVNVKNKTVLLRLDLNLPRTCTQEYDLSRLKRSVPTLKYLIEQGAKIVVLSHNGSPKGTFTPHLSLAPIVDLLKKELNGKEVKFLLDILSPDARIQIQKLLPGEIILAENIRFHIAEEKNDLNFSKKIAALGDVYVNEAFSCSHRMHASIVSLPKFLPSSIGILFAEELQVLNKHLKNPQRPMMGIVGGAKVSSKLEMLIALSKQVDVLAIGGAMANTFLKASNHSIGQSVCEPQCLDLAKQVIALSYEHKCKLLLPHDVVTKNSSLDGKCKCNVASIDAIQETDSILDIGPSSIFSIITHLNSMATVVWNGPLGAFEQIPFDIGTSTICRAIAGLTAHNKLISIVGGGDVVSAVNATKLEDCFTYVSTGGGAFLKWLEGKELPGIEAVAQSMHNRQKVTL